METFVYRPKGVYSKEMRFEMDGDIIRSVAITGGCTDSLLGTSGTIKDKKISEVLDTFHGVRYGVKPASCLGQIAEALGEYAKKLGQTGSLYL